jgi:ATP-dependent DNA helicase
LLYWYKVQILTLRKPDVPVMLYHGNKEERSLIRKRHLNIVGGKFLGRRGALPVIITSFEIAMNDAKMLALVPWKYLAVDEGHRFFFYTCFTGTKIHALSH